MTARPVDFRSDTVTRPSAAMLAAMAAAEVGDDQYGEDPTINELQARCADLLGKEAALWVPTGTMANQISLRLLTRPGDDVIVSHGSHAVLHETGAAGANAGVQFTPIGQRGVFTAGDLRAACKPRGHVVLPPTTLVQIENTHNREGGIVFPQAEAVAVCAAAGELGLATYLDGARIWNAAIASDSTPAALAAPFDLVGVAFSKGLGAPGGSLLAGSAELIGRAVRYRRMLGGAMRQVGSFAAAALYALANNYDRLADDHANARLVADELAQSPRVVLDPTAVATNIVVFGLTPDAPPAAEVVARAAEEGVRVFAFGPRTVRAVTHLDVDAAVCREGARTLRRVIDA